jgi:sugar transferase (PEP-CTERM/EpsH1 system associated)
VKVLYLCHRSPWPPDKGDRVRSHGILEWLTQRHDVWLGAFADGSSQDEVRAAEEALRGKCADVLIVPRPSIVRGMRAAVTGNPISVEVFSSPKLDAWVEDVALRVGPAAALGFSAQTARLLFKLHVPRRVLDMVDVDSEKWRERFKLSRNPVHWMEARRVRALEERCVRDLDAVLLTTSREAAHLGGESRKVRVVANGVDHAFFARRAADPGGAKIGFVGAMDYGPNAEGALWFAREVLPKIREKRPDAEFVVVGRRPPDELSRTPGVTTTGFLDDLRPTLGACAIGVAPVLSAHGVQTKATVTLSMGVPMVLTPATAEGLGAVADVHAKVAADPLEFARACLSLLDNAAERGRFARAARTFVEERFDWGRNLAVLEGLLAPSASVAR